MPKSLQYAEEKWGRKAEAGSPNWHGDVNAYCQGLAPYGLPVNECMAGVGARYNAGVTAPGAAAAQAAGVREAVQNNRWGRRWLAGITKRGA